MDNRSRRYGRRLSVGLVLIGALYVVAPSGVLDALAQLVDALFIDSNGNVGMKKDAGE